ncbi:hypothetical protein JCM11641_007877 [Rhodosporidiobolus odoratus]
MGDQLGNLPDWLQGAVNPPQQSGDTDGSSAEMAIPSSSSVRFTGEPDWPWAPQPTDGENGPSPYPDAPPSANSAAPHPDTFSQIPQHYAPNQLPPHSFSAYDYANSNTWWNNQPPMQAAGEDGVSLSMLNLQNHPDSASTSTSTPFTGGPVYVDHDIRRENIDSGIFSSASATHNFRQHSREREQTAGDAFRRESSAARKDSRTSSGPVSDSSRRGSEQSPSSGSGNGNGSGIRKRAGGEGVENSGEGTKLVQRADKSCKKCRERRVRCDRQWPTCERCRKRREACEWTEATNVDEMEEGGDAEQINHLTAKVAALERQLKTASNSARGAKHSAPPHPALPSASARAGAAVLSPSPTAYTPPSNATYDGNLSSDIHPAGIPTSVHSIWASRMNLSKAEGDALALYLSQRSIATADTGRASVTWRLGEHGMAIALTEHLLDASLRACCSKLPGIQPLAAKIGDYKYRLHNLAPVEQLHVAVLCALGARASPHSQLLGISTIALSDGTPSPPLYIFAGERREMACRHLESRARELCWQSGLIAEPTLSHLNSLVGLVQLLIYEEILPNQSRLFARNAIGMYTDMRMDAAARGETTTRDPRAGPGTALFLADAVIAAACSRPSFITSTELDQYFVTDGVPVPDIPGSDLSSELSALLQRPLTQSKLSSALTTASMWVCGCGRLFAQLTTGRRPGAPSSLPLLKNLWTLVDKVHGAVQELQQLLVSLTPSQVVDCENDPYALEHFVLLGVRFDSLLVDTVNLLHVYLMRDRNGPGVWSEKEDDPLLLKMREESNLRVRKCLKLSSFYAQLYLQSQDKHLVHHMLMQQEMLPEWTTLAAQRIGTPGGPPTEEYELTENELDWFQQALELSSYYTPKAARRLEKMAEARRKHQKGYATKGVYDLLRKAPIPTGPLPAVDHLDPQRAAEQSHQASDRHYHYDLPPHNVSSLRPVNPPDEPDFSDQGQTRKQPATMFVFDQCGVAAEHGMPLSSLPSVTDLPFVQHGFTSQTWMHSPSSASERPEARLERRLSAGQQMPDPTSEILMVQGGQVPVGQPAGPGEGMEWMRGGGRGPQAEGGELEKPRRD